MYQSSYFGEKFWSRGSKFYLTNGIYFLKDTCVLKNKKNTKIPKIINSNLSKIQLDNRNAELKTPKKKLEIYFLSQKFLSLDIKYKFDRRCDNLKKKKKNLVFKLPVNFLGKLKITSLSLFFYFNLCVLIYHAKKQILIFIEFSDVISPKKIRSDFLFYLKFSKFLLKNIKKNFPINLIQF